VPEISSVADAPTYVRRFWARCTQNRILRERNLSRGNLGV